MTISYEVALYSDGSVHPKVSVWEIAKKAYWAGEPIIRMAFVRYRYRKEPKRLRSGLHGK